MTTRAHDRWPVWGTYAFLAVSDPTRFTEARRTADRMLAEIDLACSRFRTDSALSLANRHAGRWVEAGDLLVAATRVAIAAAQESGGLVDPCLGRVMVSLGYDADLASVSMTPGRLLPPTPVRPGAWREIELSDGEVRVPADVALDLGATAKAWAADLVATTVAETWEVDVVVSLGGDVRVAGPDRDLQPHWPVVVAERPDERQGQTVLAGPGLATSSTLARRWRRGDTELHHLVDPRTGAPASETFRTVTAAGRSCVAANTASTAALVLGAEAPGWLAARGVTARLVAADGTVTTVGDWPADLDEDAA